MTKAATEARLWYLQRISAMVLAMCVLVHLATVVYAVRGGLSAAEILGRTQGSFAVALFYVTFVIACAVHAPIGLARIAEEWLGWTSRASNFAAGAFALILLGCGLRAVYALVAV